VPAMALYEQQTAMQKRTNWRWRRKAIKISGEAKVATDAGISVPEYLLLTYPDECLRGTARHGQ